jgi:hypothetical protein
MKKLLTAQASIFQLASSLSLTIQVDGILTLIVRYDEMGIYYNASGVPTEPPPKPQGKNRGFATSTYDQHQGGRQPAYGGRFQGDSGHRERDEGRRSDRHGGYGGGDRRHYGGGGRDRRRDHDDDFDDDPINMEFGGDDDEDYYYDKQSKNKVDDEKIERAFKLESRPGFMAEKKADLLSYIHDRINKDVIYLYFDIQPTGKAAVTQKDVEALLSSKGVKDFKLVEKTASSTSTTKVFTLHLKTKEDAIKALQVEGEVFCSLTKVSSWPESDEYRDSERKTE